MDNTVSQNSSKSTHLCRRCGRKLKSESSKERGMGETCYRKWLIEDNHKKLFLSPSLQTSKKSV